MTYAVWDDPDKVDRLGCYSCRAVRGDSFEALRKQCCCDGEELMAFSHSDGRLYPIWEEQDVVRFSAEPTEYVFVAAKQVA